jgi:hypothetical protein
MVVCVCVGGGGDEARGASQDRAWPGNGEPVLRVGVRVVGGSKWRGKAAAVRRSAGAARGGFWARATWVTALGVAQRTPYSCMSFFWPGFRCWAIASRPIIERSSREAHDSRAQRSSDSVPASLRDSVV